MRQSLKAKAQNLGPLAPGAQWLWARLEPMWHRRPGRPVRSRCGGSRPGALARTSIGAAANVLAPRRSAATGGQPGGIRVERTRPRRNSAAPDRLRPLPLPALSGRPRAESAIAPGRWPRRCAPGARLQKAIEQAPYARASQTLKPPVKTGALGAAGFLSPARAPGYAHTDTRIRIRACPGTGLETPDSKTEFSILKSGIRKPKFGV